MEWPVIISLLTCRSSTGRSSTKRSAPSGSGTPRAFVSEVGASNSLPNRRPPASNLRYRQRTTREIGGVKRDDPFDSRPPPTGRFQYRTSSSRPPGRRTFPARLPHAGKNGARSVCPGLPYKQRAISGTTNLLD
ncbi:Hypothetical protein NTJ_08539 [Nesidiocoris tenuis]|uniref:Uncharacterized protein n=1 Tax=Nesidiocoris tenuis TaxID=355587 RepID=A0ABN7AU40_9HEMI|nr:Hypothetical protein NTJ_08539 [Nesidiocoris tenuis]